MSRKLIAKIHWYLAAFLAPVIILMATSGGLYLLGYKGNVTENTVFNDASYRFDSGAADLKSEVDKLLSLAGIEYEYEYVKASGSKFITRPTSRDYFVVSASDNGVVITQEQPDLVKTLVELHKGHGPTFFKTLQKFTALGLLLIVISGLWLALAMPNTRNKAMVTFVVGLVLFVAAAMM